MRHAILFSAFSAFVLAACGGSTSDGSQGSTADQKSAAAAKLASGEAKGDPCTDNKWYGDGACDGFCPQKDTDCVAGGDPVVCDTFLEASDGTCSRKPTDPCISQDPDCTGGGSPGNPGHVDPTPPVYCAAISEVPNGVCNRAKDDPCISQDPDCDQPPPGLVDCDTRYVKCETFAPVTCPDGLVPSVVNGCYGECVKKESCMPVACPAIALAPDGVCSPQPEGACQLTDPDCVTPPDPGAGGTSGGGGGVACAEYIEQPDGACSRAADDPCIFQDPDCTKK